MMNLLDGQQIWVDQEWIEEYPEPAGRQQSQKREAPLACRLGFDQRRQEGKPEGPKRQGEEEEHQRRIVGFRESALLKGLPDETLADLL